MRRSEFVTYGQDLEHNPRTGAITWNIGSLPSNAGFLLPAPEAAFQVSIKPSLGQVGKTVTLTKESEAEGKDIFTNVGLKSVTSPLDTGNADPEKGAVVQ